jgi:dihydropyrimidine dehydrogenase (NAD+) subunit PreT
MAIHDHEGLAEHVPPLTRQEASVEANRCLFCYDAPCVQACPTHIDIPLFIRKISTDNLTGSARTIYEANLLGATCARVCPVQELCEGACVLGAEHRPIMIGRLQRHAMDYAAARGLALRKSQPTGRKVAVVGSGPAGLSCAGELARRGHEVTIFERRSLPGGLSTYGIISLREPVEASLAEVKLIESLGVKIQTTSELGSDFQMDDLRGKYDAVFLGLGLGATPAMGIPGEEHIIDGLFYIEQSKLQHHEMQIGRHVTVIGAGNTAIDCATVARRLGAEKVTMIYRRTAREMSAYQHEYEFVRKEGVGFLFLTQPVAIESEDGQVTGIRAVKTGPGAGLEFFIETDQVVKAIGQEKPSLAERLGLAVERGYIQVDTHFETSIPGVFAGGDCVRAKNVASTVMAVQDGKLAAAAIHERVMKAEATRG